MKKPRLLKDEWRPKVGRCTQCFVSKGMVVTCELHTTGWWWIHPLAMPGWFRPVREAKRLAAELARGK